MTAPREASRQAYSDTVTAPRSAPLGEIWPDRETFRELAARQRIVPVTVRYLADGETPVGLFRKLAGDAPGTFLLESAVAGEWDRYSIIGAGALATLTSRDGEAYWMGDVPVGVPVSGDPLQAFRAATAAFHGDRIDGLPPFTGGLVGYIAYDAVRRWEKLPTDNPDEIGVPELGMMLATDVAVYDHADSTVLLVANAINADDTPDRVDQAYDRSVQRLRAMTGKLAAPAASTVASYRMVDDPPTDSRTRPEDFQAAVETAVRDIIDGEAFQIVVSQRFETPAAAHPLDVYRVLRRLNPSPYMYLVRTTDTAGTPIDIVGASPESLVTVRDGWATTHPIAGSRPRGATADEDERLGRELAADEKENAEHLMLVDLARNDLQKFCRPGTVEVTSLKRVEKFSHIQHLVSTVTGRIAEGRTAYDALAACFPAGTLSGAPKPRAMQLIDRLEPARRGLYGGTVGYVDFSGAMDMAIAIRTALIKDGTGYVQAGGGIVADSVALMEHRESRSKAAAMIRAIASAGTLEQPADPGGSLSDRGLQ